jgi:hypothetical protein
MARTGTIKILPVIILLSLIFCSKKENPPKITPVLPQPTIRKEALRALQSKIDELGRKAKAGKYRDFNPLDRMLLATGFQSLVAGGYAQGYDGAAKVLEHYLSGNGRDLAVDPDYFRKSPVVVKLLEKRFQALKLTPGKAKRDQLRIDPADHGWEDANLRYMMNPFFLNIKDSLVEGVIHSEYEVCCRIQFHPDSKTYFFFSGDTIIFPDNLGAALESLGMGKPFELRSSWRDRRAYREGRSSRAGRALKGNFS